MPYRSRPETKPDPEPAAADTLRRRVYRVRLASVIACTAPVVVLTFVVAMRVTGVDLLSFAVRMVVIFGSFGIAGAFCVGLFLSQGIIRRRLERWLDEVSRQHGVPRGDLVKYTTPWR